MNYIRITIPIPEGSAREILIARLSEQGFEGFEEDEAGGALHAFIPEPQLAVEALSDLLTEGELSFEQSIIPEQNWNSAWEKDFHPVVVEGFCAVRAFFHEPVAGVPHDLLITPKMSFGTGHHATTYMMLEAMRSLDFAARTVLDFGTGTGVLAILADKLGAVRVLAIDNDDWSIENARENAIVNRSAAVTVAKMELIPDNELFSIILANINKNTILARLQAMRQQLREGGVILLSGLLMEDLEEMERAAAHNALTISERMTRNNWLCLRLELLHSNYSAAS